MWAETMVSMLKALVGELGNNYSDRRLSEFLAVAAKRTMEEVSFKNDYEITLTPSIIPDPVVEDDGIFVAMVVLKAASIISDKLDLDIPNEFQNNYNRLRKEFNFKKMESICSVIDTEILNRK